jgi:ABC-type transporter Mla subunit MlaD
MKLPGLETILEDVKEMQNDLNTRLDRIADLLAELLAVQKVQAQAAQEFATALNGINTTNKEVL